MAVDSKSIFTGGAIFVTVLLGVVMAVFVTTNAAGGLAALVPLISGILCLLAIIKPKAGLYGLAALVIWVDEFKRLAVYFGGAYSTTVAQVLAMPFLVLAALNIGYFINILWGRTRIDKLGVGIYLFAAVVGAVVFVTAEGTITSRIQRAASLAGYMALVPVAYAYLRDFDDWRKFFAFQIIVALPSAAWAIKQYFYGFDHIEWTYAQSGLSIVHYSQMILSPNPRAFGFFGSASALGCVSIYATFAAWHAFRYREKRFFWLLAAALLAVTLVASAQRTVLVYPFIVAFAAIAFRRKLTTLAFYAVTSGLFLIGVATSDYLLNRGLDDINRTIASNSAWGSRVLNVNTFSDRIRGWQRLKRPESWSILGTTTASAGLTQRGSAYDEDYNHDVINKILISYGIIGLLGVVIPGTIALVVLHRTILSRYNPEGTNDPAFALALCLPMIGLSLIGGDNFSTNPINLQIWTAFAGVLVIYKVLHENRNFAPQVRADHLSHQGWRQPKNAEG